MENYGDQENELKKIRINFVWLNFILLKFYRIKLMYN